MADHANPADQGDPVNQGTQKPDQVPKEEDDSLERLFQKFPRPVFGDAHSMPNMIEVFKAFLEEPIGNDPDHEFIHDHIAQVVCAMEETPELFFVQQIAWLALEKQVSRKLKTAKAQQMRYFRWIASGKKTESYPFPTGEPKGLPSTTRLSSLVDNAPKCEACGKVDRVNFRCPECSLSDDTHIFMRTAYCNKQCMEAHRQKHANVCRHRIMLQRAVALLEFTFNRVVEATWTFPLAKLEVTKNLVRMTHDQFHRNGMIGRPLFNKAPRHMKVDDDIWENLYKIGQTGEYRLSHFELVKFIFTPICRSIEHASIAVKNAIRPVIGVSTFGYALNYAVQSYQVMKLTLNSGEEYVVDLTGVQCGWKEVLAPWNAWSELRAWPNYQLSPLRPGTLQYANSDIENNVDGHQVDARDDVIASLVLELQEVVAGMQTAKAAKSVKSAKTFKAILSLPRDEYIPMERRISEMVKHKVFILIKTQYRHPEYKLGLGGPPCHPVITVGDHLDAYKKVWFTAKEYDEFPGGQGELLKMYTDRLIAQKLYTPKERQEACQNKHHSSERPEDGKNESSPEQGMSAQGLPRKSEYTLGYLKSQCEFMKKHLLTLFANPTREDQQFIARAAATQHDDGGLWHWPRAYDTAIKEVNERVTLAKEEAASRYPHTVADNGSGQGTSFFPAPQPAPSGSGERQPDPAESIWEKHLGDRVDYHYQPYTRATMAHLNKIIDEVVVHVTRLSLVNPRISSKTGKPMATSTPEDKTMALIDAIAKLELEPKVPPKKGEHKRGAENIRPPIGVATSGGIFVPQGPTSVQVTGNSIRFTTDGDWYGPPQGESPAEGSSRKGKEAAGVQEEGSSREGQEPAGSQTEGGSRKGKEPAGPEAEASSRKGKEPAGVR